jgi:hypothetical protein
MVYRSTKSAKCTDQIFCEGLFLTWLLHLSMRTAIELARSSFKIESQFFQRLLTIHMTIIGESYIKIGLMVFKGQGSEVCILNKKHCQLWSFCESALLKISIFRWVSPFFSYHRRSLSFVMSVLITSISMP